MQWGRHATVHRRLRREAGVPHAGARATLPVARIHASPPPCPPVLARSCQVGALGCPSPRPSPGQAPTLSPSPSGHWSSACSWKAEGDGERETAGGRPQAAHCGGSGTSAAGVVHNVKERGASAGRTARSRAGNGANCNGAATGRENDGAGLLLPALT